MLFGILTLITALTISAVAIYYSVAGLVAIFAAAPVAIIIMGSALEIGKLVTAVWLHKYWDQAVWWLKTYLSVAVVVLMFITSMGIFGFLSSAHIEQTATAQENLARIEQIQEQILAEENTVSRAESRIEQLESSGSTQDEQIQQQIDREQARIDSAYSRIQPSIDEQNQIIDRAESNNNERISEVQTQIAVINQRLADLDSALADNNVRLAQGIVGVRQDGSLGPGTERAIQSFRDQQETQKAQLNSQIETIRSAPNPIADAARTEIQRLRSIAETEITSSNELISRLRQQLGTVNVEEQSRLVGEQRDLVRAAQARLETLTQQKFELETTYRRLEAEVGPVKYLAEFIYGESADKNLLEEAVRWVIVIIIFVFDPLAVLLLIASQYTFEINSRNKKQKVSNIEDNKNELLDRTDVKGTTFKEHSITDSGPAKTAFFGQHSIVEGAVEDDRAGDNGGDTSERVDGGSTAALTEEEIRILAYEEKEQQEEFNNDKEAWKHDNPDQTLKKYKTLYIQGKIDSLPWEGYTSYRQNEEQNENSLFQKLRRNDNN